MKKLIFVFLIWAWVFWAFSANAEMLIDDRNSIDRLGGIYRPTSILDSWDGVFRIMRPGSIPFLLYWDGVGAGDGALANGQVLDSYAEGISTKQDGAGTLTVVDSGAGSVAVSSNKLLVNGSSSGFTDTGVSSSGLTNQLGGVFFTKIRSNTGTNNRFIVSLDSASSASTTPNIGVLECYSDAGCFIHKVETSSVTSDDDPVIFTLVANTEYDLAFVSGGCDSNGQRYISGDTKTDFMRCGYWFGRGGVFTNWTLLYDGLGFAYDISATPVYIHNYVWLNASSINFDDIATPSAPLATVDAVLIPKVHDRFNDTNGDDLKAAHTPDAGSTWGYRVSDSSFDIDTNTCELETDGTNPANNPTIRYAYQDTDLTNIFMALRIVCDQTNTQMNGVLFRGKADSANGANFFSWGAYGDGSNCDAVLRKVIDGTPTDTTVVAGGLTNAQPYQMYVSDDGNNIRLHFYNHQGFGENGTVVTDNTNLTDGDWQGIYAETTSHTNQAFENFFLTGRLVNGAGQTYESILGNYR